MEKLNTFVGYIENLTTNTIELSKTEKEESGNIICRTILLKISDKIKEKINNDKNIEKGLCVGVVYDESNTIVKLSYLKSSRG